MKKPAARSTDVVLITSSFLPRFGGVEEHVLNVAKVLSARGLAVAIWSVDQSDPGTVDSVGDVTVRYLPCPMPARRPRPMINFAVRLPRALYSWWTAWRQDRPRLLHVHCFGPNGVWAGRLSRLVGAPLIISTHGETFFDDMDAFGRSALLRHELSWGLRQSVAVTACSGYVAADLDRFGTDPASVVVVPNGIDAGETPARLPAGLPPRYLLGLGRLVRPKGFDLLIKAYAAARHPDVQLVIAGDGPERQRLVDLAKECGVADSVHFPGRLDHRQVTAVMAAAELLVVPSRAEPFGIVILEGWRACVPVIATSLGGPPEFVEDGVTGYLVDPEDIGALASRILEVVNDVHGAAAVAAAGKAKIAEFSWGHVADQYEGLYRRQRMDSAGGTAQSLPGAEPGQLQRPGSSGLG